MNTQRTLRGLGMGQCSGKPYSQIAQADRLHFPLAQPLAAAFCHFVPTHGLPTDIQKPASCPPLPLQHCSLLRVTPSLPATPPRCLTLTQRLASGAGILSLLWKWEKAQASKLTECPKTHTASRADTPLTTCDGEDVLLSVVLTRSRSLYLPAHPPGHLSPEIVCTRLARILSLPWWGARPCTA